MTVFNLDTLGSDGPTDGRDRDDRGGGSDYLYRKGKRLLMDEHDAQVLSDVATYGWHVVLIEEDEEGPAYGFSVGLYHTYQHPEIVVFGLKIDSLQQIINTMGREISGGKRYRSGEESGDVLEGHSCALLTVDPRWYSEYLGYAQWFYKGDGFPALECVWPDKHQKYPWQDGFTEALRPKQPMLMSWPSSSMPAT